MVVERRVIASWVKPPLWSLCDMLGVDRVDNTTSESSSCNKRNGNCVTYFDGTETPPPSASADYDVALLFVQTSSRRNRPDKFNIWRRAGEHAGPMESCNGKDI